MPSFFDPREIPGPLDEQTDLYEFFESAVFIETGRVGHEDLHEELFAIWQADMEIMNGGLAFFLLNSSGDMAEDAVFGFRRFGLPELGGVLEQAFQAVGAGEIPKDAEERRQWIVEAIGEAPDHRTLMTKLADHMHPFDRRYYDIKNAIDGERGGQGFLWRICRCIEAHRDIFFPAP